MSSVPTRVDTERGSPLEGAELTRAQKLTLYRDGFVVLKGVVPRELTRAARRRIFEPTEAERREGAGKLGFAPEITGLLINSPFRAVLENTLGEFDRPISTQVGVTPAGGTRTAENAKKYRRNSPNGGGGDGYNLLGYHEEGFPFYNATIHMDGLTTCPIPQERCAEERTPEEIYLDYIDGPWSEQSGGSRGRHAENYGTNGGMLFQDKGCSLSTGSFSAFAVVCLNDQSIPGRGQFSVLRGAHHAMQSFYRMQMEMGGIVGPEGPGWPRLDYSAPNRCGLVYLPEMVREHFLDAMAEPTPDGNLWPQPTQCLMEEGDVTITLHAIPHSGSRNEGPEPRSNMIWRIRHKKRQPNKVHIGGTDHPDRLGINLVNGEWMEFDQDEPPYFPGEAGNDPFERSKYALSHIWHEWDGMQDVVAEMQAQEAATGVYPRGADPTAVAAYTARVLAEGPPRGIPYTPREARQWWANFVREHCPERYPASHQMARCAQPEPRL